MKSLRTKIHYMPWQYFIHCYYNGTELCQKKTLRKILNWIIPFCHKCQLNAATAAAAFRKITGRAKEQLDKNVKKNPLVWRSIKIMAVGHNIYDHKQQQAVGWDQSKKIGEWNRRMDRGVRILKNAFQRPKTVRQRSFPRAVRHVEFWFLLTKQASLMTAAVNDCKVKSYSVHIRAVSFVSKENLCLQTWIPPRK